MVGFFANMQTCCCCHWMGAVRHLSLAFNTHDKLMVRLAREVTQTSISKPIKPTSFISYPICNSF